MRSHRRAVQTGRFAALLALAALLAIGPAACGEDQPAGGGATTAAPNGPATASAGEPAPDAGGNRHQGDGEGGSGPGQPSPEATTSGLGAGDRSPSPAPASGFSAELNAIVTESLADLGPLADPDVIYGDPAAYAAMLRKAGVQIGAMIARLEALDPPADAAPATAALIAAYRDLGTAVDRGADAFASGSPGPINAGRAYLTKAAAKFRAALAAAYESLPGPGFGALGG